MGKNRKKRNKGDGSDPLAKPVKPPADPELAALRIDKIVPIVTDLRDDSVASRARASSAVASISSDDKLRKLLLREQVVHIVLWEILPRDDLQSKATGWNILQNLVHWEEPDFCVHLHRLDILTFMDQASEQVLETLEGKIQPYARKSKSDKHSIRQIYLSLIAIAEELSDAREEIKKALSSHQAVINLLCRLTISRSLDAVDNEDALRALWKVSESNDELVATIMSDTDSDLYGALRAVHLADTNPGLGIYATGILHNVYDVMGWRDRSPGPAGEGDASNVEHLAQQIKNINVKAALRDSGDRPRRRLTLLEAALEILASIATTYQKSMVDDNDDGDDNDEPPRGPTNGSGRAQDGDEIVDHDMQEYEEWNGFDDSGDEMMMDGDNGNPAPRGGGDSPLDMNVEEDMEAVIGEAGDDGRLKLPDLPTLQGLYDVVPDVIRLAMATWEGEQRDPDGIENMRSKAIDTINNIAWTTASFDFEEPQNREILSQWRPLANDIWSKVVTPILYSDTDDIGLASMVTGIAWAVAKSTEGEVRVGQNEHTRFIGLYKVLRQTDLAPDDGDGDDMRDPFQHPGVKCVGVVGELGRDPAPLEVNKEIFRFLLEVSLDKNSRPAELVEALNQIMDMYADENKPCEEAFWSITDDTLTKLDQAHTNCRKVFKGVNKNAEPELRGRGDESVMNLFRFIKYKSKHRPKNS